MLRIHPSIRSVPDQLPCLFPLIPLAESISAELFSLPGNAKNISQLHTIFNSAPYYGQHFSFSAPGNAHYSIHDAACVVTSYLLALPEPLVPRSVVKGWIALARQGGGIEPSRARALESGLDFWVEALNRLPAANRNLVKLLLTLFAEIVTRRDWMGKGAIAEVDARNLASAVSSALFHLEEGKERNKSLHATLALAFLIRKRGEDLQAEEGGESMPRTREMTWWKGWKGW